MSFKRKVPLSISLTTQRPKFLERFNRWTSGTFYCIKCGKRMHLMTFGYGETICPTCYAGEKQFIFLDKSYWLNRLMSRFIKEPVMTKCYWRIGQYCEICKEKVAGTLEFSSKKEECDSIYAYNQRLKLHEGKISRPYGGKF